MAGFGFWFGFGLYTICIVMVWGFFFIARLHFFKFKDYSTHLAPITKFVALTLLVLTLIGYYFVLNISNDSEQQNKTQKETVNKIY